MKYAIQILKDNSYLSRHQGMVFLPNVSDIKWFISDKAALNKASLLGLEFIFPYRIITEEEVINNDKVRSC